MTKITPQIKEPAHFRFWLTAWISIYILIILFGLLYPDATFAAIFKVASIFLCFVYTLFLVPQNFLLSLALLTTALSDILLAINNVSFPGLVCFFATQVIHLARLNSPAQTKPIYFLCCSTAVFVILNLFLHFLPDIYPIAFCYAVILLLNIISSWHWFRHEPNNRCARYALVGFGLFSCCDLCTVVSYFSLIGTLPAILYRIANFAAWFFYYPSQVLLSNSPKTETDEIVSKTKICDIMTPKEGNR